MRYIYKISGKISLMFYIFTLYRIWHLCQYGGLRSHVPTLAVGMTDFVGTFILWAISRKVIRKTDSAYREKRTVFYTEIAIFIMATLFFGGRIVYSAIPYHGALSWKMEEWLHKKEIKKLHEKVSQKGYTIVPLNVHLSKGYVKLEIALARGKKNYDKRESLAKKDVERDLQRMAKER